MEKTTNDMESNFVQDYLFAIFLSWLPFHIIIPNRFYFLDGKAMDVLPQIPGYFVLYGVMYLFVLLGILSISDMLPENITTLYFVTAGIMYFLQASILVYLVSHKNKSVADYKRIRRELL